MISYGITDTGVDCNEYYSDDGYCGPGWAGGLRGCCEEVWFRLYSLTDPLWIRWNGFFYFLVVKNCFLIF
ncbi:hypothetical protein DGMP_02620 [Desulfomarina profundi]|uniref:Uncharacterized protein n=1 Tax=Desulfomarina profundi TaxID=2772557 RepID=A0A8D5JG32_9BACT|nr:hypothetical protein DGMP_02620 [Desulfomarina profundi]